MRINTAAKNDRFLELLCKTSDHKKQCGNLELQTNFSASHT